MRYIPNTNRLLAALLMVCDLQVINNARFDGGVEAAESFCASCLSLRLAPHDLLYCVG